MQQRDDDDDEVCSHECSDSCCINMGSQQPLRVCFCTWAMAFFAAMALALFWVSYFSAVVAPIVLVGHPSAGSTPASNHPRFGREMDRGRELEREREREGERGRDHAFSGATLEPVRHPSPSITSANSHSSFDHAYSGTRLQREEERQRKKASRKTMTGRMTPAFSSQCNRQHSPLHNRCPDGSWLTQYGLPEREARQPVFVDIGCNKGYESAKVMARWWPKAGINPNTLGVAHKQMVTHKYCGNCGDCHDRVKLPRGAKALQPRIHCIEGAPKTLNRTRTAFRRAAVDVDALATVHFHNFAMSNRTGKIVFGDCDAMETCRFSKGTPVYVNTTTVDTFVAAQGLGVIDILKIDTEGAEPMVIQGALATLHSGQAKLISIELNPHQWVHFTTFDVEDLVNVLDDYGYTCYADGVPPLMLLTGCIHDSKFQQKPMRNIICALRLDRDVARTLSRMAQL